MLRCQKEQSTQCREQLQHAFAGVQRFADPGVPVNSQLLLHVGTV